MSFFRKKRMLANMLVLSLIVSSCSLSACDSFTGLFPIGGNTADSSLDESESDSNDMGEGSSLGDNGNGDSTLDDSTGGTTDGENDGNEEDDSGDDTENDDVTPDLQHACTLDPYVGMTATEFYQNYTVACCNQNAAYRTKHGFLSGELTVPDQAPTLAKTQPKNGDLYVRNSEMLFYENGNTYTVVDCFNKPVFNVYREGAYITLEEVAAYVYAFGTYPKNHSASKSTKPSSSTWGQYLRVNHSKFSGDTSRYPYEPKLPNITGCGGSLQYWEMDIGTTGTDCDPSYSAVIYNNGSKITRGAARIVYGKNDLNSNGIYEFGEFHVFYTYNHYNDFQEYLNYQGGWGEMFGNVTGGGKLSDKYNCNPTSYVNVVWQAI